MQPDSVVYRVTTVYPNDNSYRQNGFCFLLIFYVQLFMDLASDSLTTMNLSVSEFSFVLCNHLGTIHNRAAKNVMAQGWEFHIFKR